MQNTRKALLKDHLKKFEPKDQGYFQKSSSMGSNFSCTPSDLPVYQYMLEWLETRKYVLQPSTYNSYAELINAESKNTIPQPDSQWRL